ncbi:MAG: TonB-dependent receptor domain-containing protein [Pseudohongiellaceae bacterium]
MKHKFPFKRSTIAAGFILAGLSLPVAAQQDDDDVEEIIVTGSYIRHSPLDAPSPVTVVDRNSIEAQGASVLWDVIRNLEVNSGSDTSIAGSLDPGGVSLSQLTGTAQANLRNLGGNSTLTLINGRRMTPAAAVSSSGQEYVDLNTIPLMMTDRVEVLTDGGSALYGSDAVAGVVNVIMRTEYEGFELYGELNGIEAASNLYDQRVSGIWGWSSNDGNTNFVLSAEHFERDHVSAEYSSYYDPDAGSYNSRVGALGTPFTNTNLGFYTEPAYVNEELTALNIAEDNNATPVLGDPLCTTLSGPNGAFYRDNRYSGLGGNNANCFENGVDFSTIATGGERRSVALSFEHSFSDSAEIYAFGSWSDVTTDREIGGGRVASRSVHYYIPPPGSSQPDRAARELVAGDVAAGVVAAELVAAGVFPDTATATMIITGRRENIPEALRPTIDTSIAAATAVITGPRDQIPGALLPFVDGAINAPLGFLGGLSPLAAVTMGGGAAQLGGLAAFAGNAVPTADDITNSPLDRRNGGLGTGMFGGATAIGWPRNGEEAQTFSDTAQIQLGIRGEFEVGERSYNYDVSYALSSSSIEQDYLTLNRYKTEMALQGLGGPNCTPNGIPNLDYANHPATSAVWSGFADNFNDLPFPGYILNLREVFSYALTSNNHGKDGCMFYNPFLTALSNPDVANDPELIAWMREDVRRADKRNKLGVIDAIVSGELFDMAGGTAQFATGLHYRERNAKSRAPTINLPGVSADLPGGMDPIIGYNADGSEIRGYVTGNLECSNCIFNFDHDRNVSAIFVELSLPFAEDVETQVALRYEDYGENIGAELTSKIAMSWRPIDELLLRGSFSQSFRAPNIGVVFEAFEASSTSVQDPISNRLVRANLLEPTNENAEAESSFTLGAPNPNLGNEYADTYNIGFQWTPGGALDGFSFGVDAWLFEVEDRVLPQVPRAALQPEIDLFNQVKQDPTKYVFNGSIAPAHHSFYTQQYQPCNPDDPALTPYDPDNPPEDADELRGTRGDCVVDPREYRISGVQRLIGSTVASLVTIQLPAVNAGNIEVSGADLKMGYNWDNDWGTFRAGLTFTHVHQYLVQDIPGFEFGLQETGRTDAAGVNGDAPIVRSVPDNKGHVSLSWTRGNHSVAVFNRHIGSYEVLSYRNNVPRTSSRLLPYLKGKIDSYDTWDIQYNYTHNWGNDSLGTTHFSFGLIDAFDAELPLHAFQTYDSSVFDARGRRWYGRARWEF